MKRIFILLTLFASMMVLSGCDWPNYSPPKVEFAPDLKVIVTPTSMHSVNVTVSNIGNRILNNSHEVYVTFGGHTPLKFPFNGAFDVGQSYSVYALADYGSFPIKLSVGVTQLGWPQTELWIGNNNVNCSWIIDWERWECRYPLGEGPSVLTTSTMIDHTIQDTSPTQTGINTLDNITTKDDENEFIPYSSGSFAGSFFGMMDGIDDSNAPFLIYFGEVGGFPAISTTFLAGLRLRICGNEGPIWPFEEMVELEGLTSNSFTTGPIRTKNEASIIMSGIKSDDGNAIDISLEIDPDPNSCDNSTLITSVRKYQSPMDLTLELEDFSSAIIVGRDIHYELMIRNNGQITVDEAELLVNIPESLEASISERQKPKDACNQYSNTSTSGFLKTCSFPVGVMHPGDNKIIDIVVHTSSYSEDGPIEANFELVLRGDPTTDIAPSDNSISIITDLAWISYLPTVSQNAGADLIIAKVELDSQGLIVNVENVGTMATSYPFWVDLYVDPDSIPTRPNDIWADGRSKYGLVWHIDPYIQPGETITLTIDDPNFRPLLSRVPNALPKGTLIYVQVDSANTETTYGGVHEMHEIPGSTMSYNNLHSLILEEDAIIVPLNPVPEQRIASGDGSDGELPLRP